MTRSMYFLVGFFVSCCALLAMIHGLRAGLSEWHYVIGRYGRGAANIDVKLEHMRKAHAVYRFNHHLCAHAGQAALAASLRIETERPEDAARYFKIAEEWCETGLYLNRFRPDLVELKANLLAFKEPSKAASYWKKYLERVFWDPHNHRQMVVYSALIGDFETAFDHLDWLRRSGNIEEIRKAERSIEAAWNDLAGALRRGVTP